MTSANMKSVWTESLTDSWTSHFSSGVKPQFLVQTPGRVNLIGEHTDHQAYPVCPCAIRQSLGAAVYVEPKTADNNALELAHVQPIYPARVYKEPSDLRVEADKTWTNYICAAYFGVVEFFINGEQAEQVGKLIEPKKGLTAELIATAKTKANSPINYSVRILFDGDVPPCAGLSSSAAVVVGTTLALLSAGGVVPENKVVADICAKAERYTGVASGGMDQAAVLLSQEGSVTLINFKPLETECITLPQGGALLIANTCRQCPKAALAGKLYNKRVFELKAGCLALLPKEVARNMTAEELVDLQLRDVVRKYLKAAESDVFRNLSLLIPSTAWTKAEMTDIFNEQRRDFLLTHLCGKEVWEQNEQFFVFQRVRHVLSEALRVKGFVEAAQATYLTDLQKLERMGDLMNSSAQSLAEDFDCSTPEIEKVVQLCRANGAYGARLTGAGWGGCVVALIDEKDNAKIISAIKREYFEPIFEGVEVLTPPLEALPSTRDELDTCVFVTTPAAGAFVQKL